MNIYNEYITIYITNSRSFLLSIKLDTDFKIRIKKIHSFYKYIFNKKKSPRKSVIYKKNLF